MSTAILVVDDEPRMRTLLKDFLVKKDYEVIEAKDGEEALEIFRRKRRCNKINITRCYDAKTRWMVCTKANKAKESENSNNNAYGKGRRTRRAFWV